MVRQNTIKYAKSTYLPSFLDQQQISQDKDKQILGWNESMIFLLFVLCLYRLIGIFIVSDLTHAYHST